MMNRRENGKAGDQSDSRRIVKAVHGRRKIERDPPFEFEMADHLRGYLTSDQLREAFAEYADGASHLDILMRRICFRALVRKLGSGVNLRSGVSVIHPETMEFGEGVYIGERVIVQGRYDGRCVIGNGVWIGAQCFFDARDLFIGDYVGIGPGVKILGSEHTGLPVDLPIIQTDLEVAPVRIEAWADIGINAAILPGVTIGQGALVGAGAVVIRDVPDFCTVAGVPAQVIATRDPAKARNAHARAAPAGAASPRPPTPIPLRGNS
jgi:acetyltransferase-like isoleucine patch superfamily enzyme